MFPFTCKRVLILHMLFDFFTKIYSTFQANVNIHRENEILLS